MSKEVVRCLWPLVLKDREMVKRCYIRVLGGLADYAMDFISISKKDAERMLGKPAGVDGGR